MTKFNPIFSLSLFLLLTGIVSSNKTCKEISFKFFLNVHSDCTIERIQKSDPVPPSLDAKTHVRSSDVVISDASNMKLSGRLYRPMTIPRGTRVPILIYFHGGGFLVGSPFDRNAQDQLFRISSMGKFIILSVDYALAPENKIPIQYRNGDDTLKWLAMQAAGKNKNVDEQWLKHVVDFNRVFIGGQSSGGNIAYNVAMRLQRNKIDGLKFAGLVMIHPYLLTVNPLPSLMNVNEELRNNITGLWPYVCPRTVGLTDPRVNPSLETDLKVLNPGRVLICVAERDPMIDAVRAFYNVLSMDVKKVEYYKTEGRGHAFDNIFPNIVETKNLYEKIANFIQVDREILVV